MDRSLLLLKRSLGVEELTPRGLVRGFKDKFRSDSLFQNSVYLIASTTVQAILGFIFWILAARLYSSEDIGIATALISATLLITNFSLLGFNSTFIRFLPKSQNRNSIINSGLVTVVLAAVVVSSLYVLSIGHFSQKLSFLSQNELFAILFVLFTAVDAMNTLTDSVFIAYRASLYNLIVYSCSSLSKVIGLVALGALASYGVFFSFVGSISVALVLSLFFMWRRFGFRFSPTLDKQILSKVAKFSSANYAATFATALPAQAFPIMIVNYLGASQAAYYYIAATIANMIYTIPTATSQSMFAEGSHDEEQLRQYAISALKVTSLICLPVIIGVIVLGEFVLQIFGSAYSAEAYHLLLVFAITTPLVSFFFIANAMLKVRHQIKALLISSLSFPVIAIATSFYTRQYGVIGYGYALFVAYLFGSLFLFGVLMRKPKDA